MFFSRYPALGLALTASFWLSAERSNAAVVVVNESLSSNNQIDDPPSSGLARTLSVSAPFSQILDITVSLDIGNATGETAWNGDLYVHLTGPSGTLAVLLNQTGVSPSNSAGAGDSGFHIDLNDAPANNNVHTYQSVAYSLNGTGQLTGTWASDGRSTATSGTRSNPLSQFVGENPNGVWTLYLADLAEGNMAKLNSWAITLQGAGPVPEPGSMGIVTSSLLLASTVWIQRRRSANT
jgi:subtilisin-like proprotein convertase family protein